MSYQEKRSLASIFATILIFAGYCLYAWKRLATGGAELANDLRFWGMAILIFVPVSILVRILIEIALAILNAAATRSKEDPTFSDERDQWIVLKAARFSSYVVGVGFLFSMVLLVAGQPAYVMLNIVFLSLNLGEIAESLAQLYHYRKGV